jgi:DNA replicative helicase MCM subunit Mcm2 (Cdc46/Mcm family)
LCRYIMVRDCGLEDESLSAAQLDIIFTRADLDDDLLRNNILEPHDYVEALVRIASAHATAKKGSSAVTPEEVSEALTRLLEDTVAAKAGKSEADAFRVILDLPAVRNVYRTHRDDLRLIFAKYAAADMAAVNKKTTMNFKEFEMLLKDGNLLSGGLTQQVVNKIFANVQNDTDVTEVGLYNKLNPADPLA